MKTIHREDPAKLLEQGGRVLQSRMPTAQAWFYAHGERCLARFDWPGVVSIFDSAGTLLVRSAPGAPEVVEVSPGMRGRLQ